MNARRVSLWFGLALLALGVWYGACVGPAALASGDDFSYASAAVDLSDGASLVHNFDSRALSAPYVRIHGRPGAYASKYPLGVSYLLVPLYLLAGFQGMFALSPLLAVLGVMAVYSLAWQVTQRRSVALLAAALLATLPPMVFGTSGLGSDLPSMTLVTAALSVYARYLRQPRPAWLWIFGLLAGASFLVRNPNGLLFAAAGLHQLITHRGRLRAQMPAWVGGVLAFGALAALQVGHNLLVFGSLIGGYGGEAVEGGGLSLAFLPHHLPRYLIVLCATPPLGLVAMLVVTSRRRREQQGVYVLLAALVVAFAVLYSAWWAMAFDYRHAFVGGARFVLPVLPILCLFVAIAAIDAIASVRARRVLIGAVLLAQLGASAVLTVEMRRFRQRMATHRDHIYAATARRALVVGPADWFKFLFPGDGTGSERTFVSLEAAMRLAPGQESLRLVERSLRAGEPAYVLWSDKMQGPAAIGAAAELPAHYRLVTVLDESAPYELRVDEIRSR